MISALYRLNQTAVGWGPLDFSGREPFLVQILVTRQPMIPKKVPVNTSINNNNEK